MQGRRVTIFVTNAAVYEMAVVDPGFLRGVANPNRVAASLLFWNFFLQKTA